MLYASLVFEREPLEWGQFPELLIVWLQNAGGIAAFGTLLVLVARAVQRNSFDQTIWKLPKGMQFVNVLLPFVLAAGGFCYLLVMACWLGDLIGIRGARALLPRASNATALTVGDWLLTICGTVTLCIAVTPIVIDILTRLSFGRIWAIALLSWKEAIRGRVLWIFAVIPLLFLFADWFASGNPKDQVKINVMIAYWAMGILFGFISGMLGSFSIPNDVKNNSIHTIVTKPVEKFEIVLGRFLGYGGLLTAGMFVLACMSLVYVIRGVTEEARDESYKSRVVSYGKLLFAGTKDAMRATSVGREFGYRSYITGRTTRQQDGFRQYAIWDFSDIPSNLGTRAKPIRFEYQFDIFRLSKGEEGKGMFVTFTFADGYRQPNDLDILVERIKHDREKMEDDARTRFEEAISAAADPGTRAAAETEYKTTINDIDLTLLKKHGIWQARAQEVADYHTLHFTVDPRIFAVLAKQYADRHALEQQVGKAATGPAPPLRVFLNVDTTAEQQMLGVARQDFYLLASEQPFWLNFLKGITGTWCISMLLLGVATACSTYLNGVINLLATFFVFGAGMCGEYLKEVAEKRVDSGGPTESLIRVVTGMPVAQKLDEHSTGATVVGAVDAVFSWWIGRIINLFPDTNRHDLYQYVANGFDIGWTNVILLDNLLPVAGYLLPWAILAYYLMKFREIANPS